MKQSRLCIVTVAYPFGADSVSAYLGSNPCGAVITTIKFFILHEKYSKFAVAM